MCCVRTRTCMGQRIQLTAHEHGSHRRLESAPYTLRVRVGDMPRHESTDEFTPSFTAGCVPHSSPYTHPRSATGSSCPRAATAPSSSIRSTRPPPPPWSACASAHPCRSLPSFSLHQRCKVYLHLPHGHTTHCAPSSATCEDSPAVLRSSSSVLTFLTFPSLSTTGLLNRDKHKSEYNYHQYRS